MRAFATILTSLLTALPCAAVDGQPRLASGANVLVVYAADGPDRDYDGAPDSRQAAEYYADRRGVPAGNLLGLRLGPRAGKDRCTYREFFDGVLKPVVGALDGKAGNATSTHPASERICYILVCPDVPSHVSTPPSTEPGDKSVIRTIYWRSADQWLISPQRNLAAGIDEKTGGPGAIAGRPLGRSSADLRLPLFGQFLDNRRAVHFRQLRADNPVRFGFYLVCRLGTDLDSARGMLDGAMYAERRLRLPGPDEKASFRPAIWLDQRYHFTADHVAAQARMVQLVRGQAGSPFAAGRGLLQVWPLVIDAEDAEIGLGEDTPHKPTVAATIVEGGVDADGVTLAPPGQAGRRPDASRVLYFPPGCRVTNGKASATVVGADPAANRLLLDSTEGFQAGETIRYVWPGDFPAEDCFFFYGFYGLGQYEDVFRFPPGALGIHVDSSCMTWARGAMRRGIAGTFGVTSEPLSAGVPYGDMILTALANGFDWAEACYGALPLAQRWAGVVFGDPLYAPFRSAGVKDESPPVLGSVRVRGMVVEASLAGSTADELADVAVFRVEYGPTDSYGGTIDFWPEPAKSDLVTGPRFGYTRHFRAELPDLVRGRTYHFRLTARDPAGHEIRTADATFVAKSPAKPLPKSP